MVNLIIVYNCRYVDAESWVYMSDKYFDYEHSNKWVFFPIPSLDHNIGIGTMSIVGPLWKKMQHVADFTYKNLLLP